MNAAIKVPFMAVPDWSGVCASALFSVTPEASAAFTVVALASAAWSLRAEAAAAFVVVPLASGGWTVVPRASAVFDLCARD